MPATDVEPRSINILHCDHNVAVRTSDGAQVDWVKLDRPVTDEEVAILNTSLAFVWDRVPDHDDEMYVAPKEIL